jgi:hypothetical protein
MEYLDMVNFTFEEEEVETRYRAWIMKHTGPELAIYLATALFTIYLIS